MKELTEKYCDTGFGADEAFLNKEIWPLAQKNLESLSPSPDEWINYFAFSAASIFVAFTMFYGCTACK